MKALTVHQPWASLLVTGAKRIETRGWATRHRGPLLIHSAKANPAYTRTAMAENDDVRGVMDTFRLDPDDLPRGRILGLVEVVDCVPIEEILPDLSAAERALGNYTPGWYAWVTTQPYRYDEPVRARGQQRIWNYNGPSLA